MPIYAILGRMMPRAFIPGRDTQFYLLARHLSPLPLNVARAYIEAFTARGDLVLDPFATAPTVARAALESGRSALAVDSNPLIGFAARFGAAPPPAREIENALAALGEVKKGDEPLRSHILALYSTICAGCGGAVTAEYMVWAREPGLPVEKIYRCPACGMRRDPTTTADRSQAARHTARGLHYHLLLERLVASAAPPHAATVLRELLALYTPRSLYALVTLTLKLDSEIKDDAARQILAALLIHALDVGTTLYPSVEARPERQTPETFVEVNVWHALEQAASGLGEGPPALPLAKSAQQVAESPSPCIFVGHGSAHAIAESLDAHAALILTSPSRLEPRFWELSYLWTRWTLGVNPSRLLEPFLEEEHQRWGWYGSALAGSLRDAGTLSTRDAHLVAAFPSAGLAMSEALCLAASPEFGLDTFAFRPERGAVSASEFGAARGDYQMVWTRRSAHPPAKSAQEVSQSVRRAALRGALEILSARAEPLGYAWIHHGALAQLTQDEALARTLDVSLSPRDNPFQFLHREMEAGLKEGYAEDLDHWEEPGRVLWLRRSPQRGVLPLADRVEEAVREILSRAGELSAGELDEAVLQRFPGLLAPEIELVELCAGSIAQVRNGRWAWQEQDFGDELSDALDAASRLGEALGFTVRPGEGIVALAWQDEKVIPASSGGTVRELRVREDSHLIVTAERLDARLLLRSAASPLKGMVILPERRIDLTREKLRRSPPLARALREAGWEFLRLPFIELLLRSATPGRAELQLALGLDPPLARGKEQMELF